MDNYLYAFELLKKYDMNAVVFYVGKNINSNEGYYMNKETIEKAKVDIQILNLLLILMAFMKILVKHMKKLIMIL